MAIPWDLIFQYSEQYGTDPALIAAIGQYETRWGELGAGKLGFHTGYGYYGSGSYDERFRGLETQVERTAWKMSQWGMPAGGVTLTGLQAGQAGTLPTGIYATDPNWANAVYRMYRQMLDIMPGEAKYGGSTQGVLSFLNARPPLPFDPSVDAITGAAPRDYNYTTQHQEAVRDYLADQAPPTGLYQTPAYFLALLVLFVAGGFLLYRSMGGPGLTEISDKALQVAGAVKG